MTTGATRSHPVGSALAAGTLFGAGLALAGMTDPHKVLNFLDLFGRWDPSLALVMAAAVAVTLPGYAWLRHRGRRLDGGPLHLPTVRGIDRDLALGSAVFGVGWGLAGYCPGPAVANLARPSLEVLVFLAAMALGSAIAGRMQRARARSA
jgi:uncharacterized membrane protein YedE/YeeE